MMCTRYEVEHFAASPFVFVRRVGFGPLRRKFWHTNAFPRFDNLQPFVCHTLQVRISEQEMGCFLEGGNS
jgi:hypothetical protein